MRQRQIDSPSQRSLIPLDLGPIKRGSLTDVTLWISCGTRSKPVGKMMSEVGTDSDDLGEAVLASTIGPSSTDHSSSTEGPDSPDNSLSGSPEPMLLPGGALFQYFKPDEPCTNLPRYRIEFTDQVTKNGDVVSYRILVTKLVANVNGSANGSNVDQEVKDRGPLEIDRQYEDFEYLHHNLSTQCATPGTILPPLPPRSSVSVSFKSSTMMSRSRL